MLHTLYARSLCHILVVGSWIIDLRRMLFNSSSQPHETTHALCLMTPVAMQSHPYIRRWHEFSTKRKHIALGNCVDNVWDWTPLIPWFSTTSPWFSGPTLWYYPANIQGSLQNYTNAVWHELLMQCPRWHGCHWYILMMPFYWLLLW